MTTLTHSDLETHLDHSPDLGIARLVYKIAQQTGPWQGLAQNPTDSGLLNTSHPLQFILQFIDEYNTFYINSTNINKV